MASAPAIQRKKKEPNYNSFRLQKRISPKRAAVQLPSSWSLLKSSMKLLLSQKQTTVLFIGIMVALIAVFVRGLSGGLNLADLKQQIQETTGIEGDGFVASTVLFSNLIASTATTSSELADTYQTIIFIICSLAFIWLLRQLYQSPLVKPSLRDAFYFGPQQIVPFLLVIVVIASTLIPLSIGSFILSTASAAGLSGGEYFSLLVVAVLFALLSLYLVSGFILSMYIVMLPGTRPMAALRSSLALVRLHRWSIIRKLIVFSMIVLAFLAVFFIPLLILVPDGWEFIAEGLYFIGTISLFCLGHSYLYTIYRKLMG